MIATVELQTDNLTAPFYTDSEQLGENLNLAPRNDVIRFRTFKCTFDSWLLALSSISKATQFETAIMPL